MAKQGTSQIHKPASRWKLYAPLRFALLGALLLLGLSYATGIAETWQANMRGLKALDALVHNRAIPRDVRSQILVDYCPDYIAVMEELHMLQVADLTPKQTLEAIVELEQCVPVDRLVILKLRATDAQWAMGDYQEVCSTLTSIGAADRLLHLTRTSADAGAWPAVEAGVLCAQRMDSIKAWVSPYILSSLYFRLGEHYEHMGDSEQALSAYDSAARLYPVVWAQPIIRRASLLNATGKQQEAIETLVTAVARSTDVTATFQLWRELGIQWHKHGAATDAMCAYRNALKILPQVPVENAGASERENLEAQIAALSSSAAGPCFSHYPEIHATEMASDMIPR